MALLPVARGPYTISEEGLGRVGCVASQQMRTLVGDGWGGESHPRAESKADKCRKGPSLHDHSFNKDPRISSGSIFKPISTGNWRAPATQIGEVGGRSARLSYATR